MRREFAALKNKPTSSGAESAGGCQPRATPWVTSSTDRFCALKGRRVLPPFQGGQYRLERYPRTVGPGYYPSRRWRDVVAVLSKGETRLYIFIIYLDIMMYVCPSLQPASSDAGIFRMIQPETLASEEASYSNDSAAKKKQ